MYFKLYPEQKGVFNFPIAEYIYTRAQQLMNDAPASANEQGGWGGPTVMASMLLALAQIRSKEGDVDHVW